MSCEHGKRKSRCKDCGGSAFCEHGLEKIRCKECGGSQICEHDKQKSRCKECGGSSLCEHGRAKDYCKKCKGSQICEHGKRKSRCKDCGGSALCKSSWCSVIGNRKYNGYCLRCCVHLFPDIKVARNYKTKETAVTEYVQANFTGFTWITGHRVQDGCSQRRPDLLVDFGTHILIIEVDENQHNVYDCSCENKRLMELSQDVYYRPIVFIRLNPVGKQTHKVL